MVGIQAVKDFLLLLIGVPPCAFFALAGMKVAHESLGDYRHLVAADSKDIGEVEDGDWARITGTASRLPEAPPVEAPLQSRQGVLVQWRIEEYRGHELAQESSWSTRLVAYRNSDFELRDATGAVAVRFPAETKTPIEREDVTLGSKRPEHISLTLGGLETTVETVERNESPPESVRELRRIISVPDRYDEVEIPSLTEDGPTQGDRRYFEAVVESGSELSVVGTIRNTDDGVRIEPDDTRGIYVTDGEIGETARQARWNVLTGVLTAVVFVALVVGLVVVVFR